MNAFHLGIWCVWWGSLKELVVHNLLMQFFTLHSQKMEFSATDFFDIMATHNGHPSCIKYVLGSIHVFFTLLGYQVCGGRGVSQWTTPPANAVFSPCTAQNPIKF